MECDAPQGLVAHRHMHERRGDVISCQPTVMTPEIRQKKRFKLAGRASISVTKNLIFFLIKCIAGPSDLLKPNFRCHYGNVKYPNILVRSPQAIFFK